ncbi:hypothetical protein HY450_00675 [Candidatus Pacearchaeota archaeon]|nr:hypothetical protein [Candidatus Pacearchaeota archaeon]
MDWKEWYLECLERNRRQFNQEFGVHIYGDAMVQELKQDGFFDRIKHLSIEPYDNHVDDMCELLKKEFQDEFEFRRVAVRQYIGVQGLTQSQDEIIDGMNKTAERVTMRDNSFEGHVLQHRAILQHDSSAMLRFALDYVDRWKMYNELFQTE